MKEIGGYIELDRQGGSLYHDGAVTLNCGRAALEYVIRAKRVKEIWLPYFCCDSVAQPCRKLGLVIQYYHVGYNFLPVVPEKLSSGSWLYIVNYYGQLSNEQLREFKSKYVNLIVDNAQAYFQMPIDGAHTLYTCRKFFGVSDGAFLYTDTKLGNLPQDYSYERIHYILGRFEKSAGEFYAESARNNEIFADEPVKQMSKLTDNFLRTINYGMVKKQRTENFKYLHECFLSYNRLHLVVPEGAFMYPLYIENGTVIRKALQAEKIYVPTLWPDVLKHCESGSVEYDMAENILPLPVDQRYSREDMKYIEREVVKLIPLSGNLIENK